MISSYQKNGFEFYVIVTKDNTTSIGTTGLIERDGMKNIEVGFALLQEYVGKGYAYEATKALLSYAHNTLKINPIVPITDLENKKSGKLLERLGLRFDKTIQLPNFDKPSKLFFPTD